MRSQRTTTSLLFVALLFCLTNCCPNDSMCLQCRNNICNYCAYSFPGASGVCTSPSSIIPGCYSYLSNSQCAECQDGYFYNANAANYNQTCTPLDKSIALFCRYSMISTLACSACRGNVLSNGGGCTPGPVCADSNCDSCYYDPVTGNQYCRACMPGFVLWNGALPGVCVPVGSLQGCASLYTLNYCDKCQPGNYWQNGVCYSNGGNNYGSANRFLISGLLAFAVLLFRN